MKDCQRDETKKQGPKTTKKNTNSTPNKSQTQCARAYKVTSFLSTDCELSTNPCSIFLYSLGPRRSQKRRKTTAKMGRETYERQRKKKRGRNGHHNINRESWNKMSVPEQRCVSDIYHSCSRETRVRRTQC